MMKLPHTLTRLSMLAGLLFTLAVPSPLLPSAHAASRMVEVNRIPTLLGFKQGDRLRSQGLATGTMSFTALSNSQLGMNQEITLNPFARKALEQVMGSRLTSKGNQVVFRFQIRQVANSKFAYRLYDQGNQRLLMEGPVKIQIEPGNNAQRQVVEFKAPMVSMKLNLSRPAGKSTGRATFNIGPIPVPGSLDFVKI